MENIFTVAKTDALQKVFQSFQFLLNQQGEQMGLVYGEPGVGKTTAVKHVAGEFGAIYFSCFPHMSPYFLVSALLRQTNCLDKPKSYVRAIETLIGELAGTRRAVFIDEADFLASRREMLELLRTVHDHAEVPIVFVGMTGIYNKLSYLPLFVDRIQYFLEIQACSFADAKAISEARCRVEVAEDLLLKIHLDAQGNLRLIKRMLAHVESCALREGSFQIGVEKWGDRSLLPDGAKVPNNQILRFKQRG